MRIQYVPKNFSGGSLAVIDQANAILDEYAGDGLDLTLRQLYYQFVARGLLENKQTAYKRLGSIVSDARLAGLIDWTRIEDRTRNLQGLTHWRSPAEVLQAARDSYRVDHWKGQDYQVEVWIEKDALVGVIESICHELDVPFFACRGYVSQSEMWTAAQRLLIYDKAGRSPIILHLGDHDPSGVDMTRDIVDRMATFGVDLGVRRLALNMNQVEQYSPPPNPAKITDSRAAGYIDRFGNQSWELDALEPRVLRSLIDEHVRKYRDPDALEAVLAFERRDIETLSKFIADAEGGSR